MNERRLAVRNAVLMIAQRAVQAAGGVAFFAIVPRLMGPQLYGRYALVTSLALWFALASGLGLVGATTRYVPQLRARGEHRQVRRLIGNLVTLQIASAGAAAVLYFLLATIWWPDLDRGVLGIMAASMFLQGFTSYLFAILLGFNRAERWATGDVLRRWGQLGLVVPGFLWAGLRGATVGVITTELLVAAVGLWWTRQYLAKVDFRPDLSILTPIVRFGIAILGAQWLSIAFHASGEPLVRTFAGSYVQVSYFGLAQTVYLMAASASWMLTLAFTPLLSGFLDQGLTSALNEWSGRLLRWLTAGAVVIVLGTMFLGEFLVPLVFGGAYNDVAPNLVVLSLAVLMLTLSSVSHLQAIVYERSTVPLVAGISRLVVFWMVGPFLVTGWKSLGGCLAMLVAASVHAAYVMWRMRDVNAGQLVEWLVPVGIGMLFLPLASFRSASLWDVLLYLVVVTGYLTSLLVLRGVTIAELVSLVRLVLPAPFKPVRPFEPE